MLNQIKKPIKGEEIAIMKTNYGEIKFRLFPEIAPKAVENFVTHSKDGYYNGLNFHRVIKDFMIQGGDPEGSGRGGTSIWNESFEDEFSPLYRNLKGALSMANSGPNTNGSQFFIVQKGDIEDNILEQMEKLGETKGFSDKVIQAYKEMGGAYWLDGKHTVFGQVYEGMDVVDRIASVKIGRNDMPKEPVLIEEIIIKEF